MFGNSSTRLRSYPLSDIHKYRFLSAGGVFLSFCFHFFYDIPFSAINEQELLHNIKAISSIVKNFWIWLPGLPKVQLEIGRLIILLAFRRIKSICTITSHAFRTWVERCTNEGSISKYNKVSAQDPGISITKSLRGQIFYPNLHISLHFCGWNKM